MEIRSYQPDDCPQLARLFYETVHCVNAKDYSQRQLDAWACGQVDLEQWNRSFLQNHTLVAVVDGVIAGFGDMDGSGYLNRLYVHKDFQGRGVATALCDRLEQACKADTFTTHASITAKSFFESRGYREVKEQQVERGGVRLTNYVMARRR